jgi:hypothetical protein
MPLPSDIDQGSVAYYDQNAEQFVSDRLDVDMSELYKPFLALVPRGGRILDAGCGSGRDSLAFLNKGYDVVSMDTLAPSASPYLAVEASHHRHLPICRLNAAFPPAQRSRPRRNFLDTDIGPASTESDLTPSSA